jgi:hypothetical protein
MARRSSGTQSETDLYPPLYQYLTQQGYTVRSEVKNCDITATKGDDLIIIEMKRAFNTALLIQAVKRQRITDSVYVALPRPRSRKNWAGIRQLLRRLELGLILVSVNGTKRGAVEVVHHPVPFQRQKRARARRAVIEEMHGRSSDLNQGGSTRRKLMTAYRENAVQIACYLDVLGPTSPKHLRALGTGPKTLSILHSNFYGWFARVHRGIYALAPRGKSELTGYRKLVNSFRRRLRKISCDQLSPS